MPNVDDHGLEVLKKAARNIGVTLKFDYALQTIISSDDRDNLYTIVRRSGTTVTYVGQNKTQLALETSPTWRVYRILISGNDTITQVLDDGKFTQTFNNPASLFGAIPFINQYSIFISGTKQINVPDNASLNFARLSPFAWSFWIKSEETTADTYIVKQLAQRGYKIYKNTGEQVEFEFRGSGGSSDTIRVVTVALIPIVASWVHVVATYSGSGTAAGQKIYFNGVLQATTTAVNGLSTDPTNTSALTFGANTGGGANINGFFDEPCLWNVELDQDDVTALYNLGTPIDPRADSGGYDKAASLVSYWPFTAEDILTLPTIGDAVGVNNATAVNIVAGNFVEDVAP